MLKVLLCVLLCTSAVRAEPVATAPRWSLRQALGRALEVHPEVLAQADLVAGARAFARGAGAPANPEVQLAATWGSPDEGANALVQRFELGGQPGLRSELGELGVQAALADQAGTRRQLALRLVDAFYSLWQAREQLRLSAQELGLAEELEEIARRRFLAEEIARNDYLRVQMERATAAAAQAGAQAEERIARARLNLLLLHPEEQEIELEGGSEPLPRAPATGLEQERDLAALLEQSETRPDLERARLEAEMAGLEADLAGSGQGPELELSAYRGRLYGTAEQGVQLAFVLPLWDWGRVGGEEARERKRAESLGRMVEVRRQQVRLEVRSAFERHRASRLRREALREQAVRALAMARLAQEGYAAGLLPLVQVLEARRASARVLQDWIAAEADYRRTSAELAWAAGADPLGVGEDAPAGADPPEPAPCSGQAGGPLGNSTRANSGENVPALSSPGAPRGPRTTQGSQP